MDRGAWQAAVHGAAKESDTTEQLNNNSTYSHKILTVFPVPHNISLELDYFTHSGFYLSIPFPYLPSPASPAVTTSLFSISMHLLLFCYIL